MEKLKDPFVWYIVLVGGAWCYWEPNLMLSIMTVSAVAGIVGISWFTLMGIMKR